MPTVTVAWDGWSADATFLRANLPGTDIPLMMVANDFFFERDQIYQTATASTILCCATRSSAAR
jgi:hypothetical protein